jgi:predicted metal-dependent enzyme (double-stranded beta helix superfamily)
MNALSPIAIRQIATPLDLLLADIDRAADASADLRPAEIARALAAHLGHPGLLEGRDCPCNPTRYTRHLLHNDPGGRYAVVAIVWAPGQMSPVHGHRTWCALGVHRGWMAESFFRRDGDTALPVGCLPRGPGATSHAQADLSAIHRLANLGTQEAVSIHVYGVAFDRFGDGVNEVYAA